MERNGSRVNAVNISRPLSLGRYEDQCEKVIVGLDMLRLYIPEIAEAQWRRGSKSALEYEKSWWYPRVSGGKSPKATNEDNSKVATIFVQQKRCVWT